MKRLELTKRQVTRVISSRAQGTDKLAWEKRVGSEQNAKVKREEIASIVT